MKNYAVLKKPDNDANITLSNGNLESTLLQSVNHSNARSTISMSSGKYYFESIPTGVSDGDDNMIGVVPSTFGTTWVGNGISVSYNCTRGWKYVNGTATDKTLAVANIGDVVGVALDVDARTIDFYLNNALATSETAPDGDLHFAVGHAKTSNTVNFGQQPFAYTPPAGYGELFQTWEQYARTALGYALDRIASLEQQRTIDLATIEDLRTRIEEALARIGSIETNEVSDDAVDTVLLTTVADLIERVEALEGA